MDALTLFRAGLTVLMLLIFAAIVWWAYGRGRNQRFDVAAHSVLEDDDALDSERREGRAT